MDEAYKLGLGVEVRVDPCMSLPSFYSLKGQLEVKVEP